MNERIEKVKTHWSENKHLYLTGAGSLVIGTIAGVLYASRADVIVSQARIQQILSYKPHATIEVFIEALGDPGNIIQDTTTGIIYASQGQAADALDVSPSLVSKHLSGQLPDAKGHVLVKLGKAMVAE